MGDWSSVRPGPSLSVSRRSFLRALGALGAVSAVPGLTACGGPDSASSGGGTAAGSATDVASGSVTFGLNANAAIPTAGYDAVFEQFTADTGIEVETNKLLYTEQVNNYLTSAPDDVLIWNAGYRMRFFAAQELVSDLSGIWEGIGDNVSEAIKAACTADDGKQYLVPFYNYPWVVFYRPSLFEERGYTVPTTLDEFTELGDAMLDDGLAPMAFADKEGWEAMGTFDIINMRLHGYDFHIALLDGQESWTDDRVGETFSVWRDLLPYHQEGALGRTWQEAAQSLQQNAAGMYLMGSFISDQFTDAELEEDLDFFAFPELNPEHGQDAIDAPIDGFMMVREPDNRPAAEELLRYLATGAAQDQYLATDRNSVGTANDVDTGAYSRLQQRYAEVIAGSANVAQYLDRDTRPDFAAPVVIPAIQEFLNNPDEAERIMASIQSQAEAIFVD